MTRVEVEVKRLDPELPLPSRAHPDDAGLDLYAAESISLKPAERGLIPTGIAVAIPSGYAGYVQPRSGLAFKQGLGLINSPGLIDSGYRGEIKVVAINLDHENVIHIERGDRIAQFVVLPVPSIELIEVDTLSETPRGSGGFGSSG
jgi:dUTP pyrophosphatase